MTTRSLLIWTLLAMSPSAQSTQIVEGLGADVARSSCLGCHGGDLIAEQRLTRDGWDREIAKMERWGTPLADEERTRLLTYLADYFGPTPAVSHDAAATRGEAVYQSACLTCHDDDLTTQQRLSPAAWGRTVDKMVRWGANVTAEQREPLLAYLVSRHGSTR